MKDFNDFLKTLSQCDIDEDMQSLSSEILRDTKEAYADLSETELLLSAATGAAVRLSLKLLERYHCWVNQVLVE